jgi:ABC-type multidrug transport system fused ATPase/permease subunit
LRLVNRDLVKSIFELLPQGTKKKLIILVSLQIFVTVLDVIAIALLGLLVSTGLRYVQNQIAEFPAWIISRIGLQELTFETQFFIIGISALLFFALRTALSIYFNLRILRYLGDKSSFASDRMVTRLFASDSNYILSKNSQELLYGMTVGIDNLILGYLGSLSILVTDIIFLSIVSLSLILFQPVTGLSALFIFGLATVIIHRITAEQGKTLSEDFSKLSVIYSQKLLESLLIYRELALRGRTQQATKEVQSPRRLALSIRARIMFLPTLGKYLFEFALIVGGTLVASIQLVVADVNGAITSMVVFVATASRVLPALIRAQGATLAMKQSEGFASLTVEQIREISSMRKVEVIEDKSSKSLVFEPRIKVENLSFKYSNTSEVILDKVSFSIEPGELVAIVGESGAGKTTLADVLLGMYPPTSGKVSVSDQPPQVASKRWPGKIAYVPQDISIIEGDIKKNVVLESSEQIDEIQIKLALEKAHLLEDVLKMPNQLNEMVGERGTRLSGGQRQRLGIARALFTDPEVIIFDEATSSLDPITEKAVTDAIYERKGSITLIVIAHRLSTVQKADLVILLEKGKVVAKGSFEEVRAIAPKFDQQARLVNL